MTASDIFKDKKDNYPQSVPKLFVNTRLREKDFFSANFWLFFYACLKRLFVARWGGPQPEGDSGSGQREDEGEWSSGCQA